MSLRLVEACDERLEVLTENPTSLALLPSSFQRNNLLCSLICFLKKFGKAGVYLCVLYHIGARETLKEALHKGQVRHALLASATTWKLLQHSLDTPVIIKKMLFTSQQSQ
jgi:hypothetical protein